MKRSASLPPARAASERSARRTIAVAVAGALALTGVGIAAPGAATAADVPAPTAHYDMSHRGQTLLDVSGNGRDATLTGLTDGSFADAAGDAVLRLRADGYAALPQGLLTASDNDFTVEYTVSTQTSANHFGWVIGDGVGPWNTTQLGNHIFLSPRSGQGGYNDQVLAAIRVKNGNSNGESRLPAGGGLNPGFTTLTMVGSGTSLTLYRDGQQISTLTHALSLSSIIPTGSVLGYLGRSLYQGDPLLRADVSDVKFWDVALTAGETDRDIRLRAGHAADEVISLAQRPGVACEQQPHGLAAGEYVQPFRFGSVGHRVPGLTRGGLRPRARSPRRPLRRSRLLLAPRPSRRSPGSSGERPRFC